MLRHHRRLAPAIALALALALTAAAPASAKFELNPVAGTQTQSSSPASPTRTGAYRNPGAPSTVVRVVAPSDGFHWGDAGIGAGGAFALTMLALGGVLVATNTRRRASRSSAQQTT